MNLLNKRNDASRMTEDLPFGKDLSFAASEAYRLLRTSLLFSLPNAEKRCRVVGITSANAGEGKSTTALNLAYMLAEAHKKVILIEADMRLPTISKRLGLNPTPGLSNILVGLAGENPLQSSGIEERLKVISAGDIPPNPSELLGSDRMKTLLDALSQNVDFIVLDLPPINEVADALVVSQFVDGIVMVVRQNYAKRSAVSFAMRQLEHANAKVLGFVMTSSGSHGKGKYKGKYKKYGYYERKAEGGEAEDKESKPSEKAASEKAPAQADEKKQAGVPEAKAEAAGTDASEQKK